MLNNIFAFAANSGRGSAVLVYAMDQAWVQGNTVWVTEQNNALVIGNGVQNGSTPHPIPPAYVVKNNQGTGCDYCSENRRRTGHQRAPNPIFIVSGCRPGCMTDCP